MRCLGANKGFFPVPTFFFFFFFSSRPLVGPCEVLNERLSQAHIALDAHTKLVQKYRERLATLEDTSASRSSHPAKRPLPVGVIRPLEEKTKKLATEPPRPSRAPKE